MGDGVDDKVRDSDLEGRNAEGHSSPPPLGAAPVRELAEFRYVLRRFLHFSEEAAARVGLPAQQHQLLLQVAGAPKGAQPTIAFLAERLVLRHHSVVELSLRCEAAGWVVRRTGALDRRLVVLELTAAGHRLLKSLSQDHARELNELAPKLIEALQAFAA